MLAFRIVEFFHPRTEDLYSFTGVIAFFFAVEIQYWKHQHRRTRASGILIFPEFIEQAAIDFLASHIRFLCKNLQMTSFFSFLEKIPIH